MRRVYIAGPYSAPTICEGLENIRRGRRMATKLLQHGIAVFCPWLDSELFMQLREGEVITLETIQAHSMAWLKASEAVLCLKGWEKSRGTLTEIQVANECGIPVFFNYHDLLAWNMAEKDIQISLASAQIGMTPTELAKKIDDVCIKAIGTDEVKP
jgi:hypothetical protein